jgi:small-conductance mechanosensitive channel
MKLQPRCIQGREESQYIFLAHPNSQWWRLIGATRILMSSAGHKAMLYSTIPIRKFAKTAVALAGVGWTFLGRAAVAQQAATGVPSPPPNPSTGGNLIGFFSNRTPYEFWLTCLICLVALIIVLILTWSVHRIDKIRPEDVTRPVIIITVIFATLVLVTAGYSNEQIAPAFGLFGTIVGYILGRMSPPGHPGDSGSPESGGTEADRTQTTDQTGDIKTRPSNSTPLEKPK